MHLLAHRGTENVRYRRELLEEHIAPSRFQQRHDSCAVVLACMHPEHMLVRCTRREHPVAALRPRVEDPDKAQRPAPHAQRHKRRRKDARAAAVL